MRGPWQQSPRKSGGKVLLSTFGSQARLMGTEESHLNRQRSWPRRFPVPSRLVSLMVALAMAAPALVPSGPASAAGKPPSCGLAPVGLVGSVYGTKFRPLASETKGQVTVCTYLSTVPVISVLVRFETGVSTADFEAARRQFDRRSEHTVSRPGFGPDAYSVVLGSGKTVTSTIVILKGSTELLVTGTGPLAKAEALAHKVLARL
jgi:hypothetical protein